jgi:hypothetical protein
LLQQTYKIFLFLNYGEIQLTPLTTTTSDTLTEFPLSSTPVYVRVNVSEANEV